MPQETCGFLCNKRVRRAEFLTFVLLFNQAGFSAINSFTKKKVRRASLRSLDAR